MGLMDDIKQANAASKQGPVCKVAVILEGMAEAERAELKAALADQGIRGTVIARVLTDRGHSISGQTISYHRRKACSCV